MSTDTLDPLDVAEAIAPTWARRADQVEEVCAPIRAWLVDELAPARGHTVLELAAGTGDTGREAVERIGAGSRLISTDLSPTMVEAARERGSRDGEADVDYRVIDAQQIDLGDDSVDGVLCRLGYMLMPDPAAALAETRRVLRPGGRLALAVWGAPERNPFFTIVALILAQRGHIPPPAPPPAPGIFAMASERRTTDLLSGAGFADARTAEVAVRFPLPDADGYLDLVADTAGPVALALRALSAADRDAVKREVEDSLGRFATPDGYAVPGVVLCAVAS